MENYCRNVLIVGPHRSLRGGIASVIDVYSKNFDGFNYLATYYYKRHFIRELFFITAVFKLLFVLATKRRIKIVHIHVSSGGSFMRKSLIVLISKLFGRKVILHVHSGGFKVFLNKSSLLKRYILYILNTANEIIVLSKEWKVYFDSILKKGNSVIVNNPVKVPNTVKDNLVQSPIKILYLNHITTNKGIFDVVETFRRYASSLKGSFKLVIAGAGDGIDKFNSMIADDELSDLVDFKGWVSGKQKDDLISDCNIFILTSYFEGLPMSILESMALGKAIIASEVGGIPSVVRPGENGWLVQAGDINALYKVLLEIKSKPSIVEAYGLNSFEKARAYSTEEVLKTLNQVYADLLGVQPAKKTPTIYQS